MGAFFRRVVLLGIGSGIALACSSFGTAPDDATDASPGDDGGPAEDASADRGAVPPTDGDTGNGGVVRRKRVFVTQKTFTATELAAPGTVLEIADGLCAQAATKLGTPGTFRAWISDGTDPANARNVFAPPYFDATQSVKIFGDDGSFSSAGLVSEMNLQPATSWWTGMNTPTAIGDTCANWKSESGYGSVGRATSWYGTADSGNETFCTKGFAGLICFEQ